MTDPEYGLLTKTIEALLAIDLTAYKTPQMRRRLDAFITRQSLAVPEFCAVVRRDQALLAQLRDMLTINVSEFFRDGAQFTRLEQEILPDLLRQTGRLRIWSAACSNGQEPYSIAMMLDSAGAAGRASVLATDIDPIALDRARAGGPYQEADIRNIPADRRARYLTNDGGQVRVSQEIRRRVQFRQLNLLSDRFESNFDLIVCRNVVIYFSDEAKSDLFGRFHSALSANGVLFLGGTETLLGPDSNGFDRLGSSFFRRQDVGAPAQRAA